jgi:hypothetical protein
VRLVQRSCTASSKRRRKRVPYLHSLQSILHSSWVPALQLVIVKTCHMYRGDTSRSMRLSLACHRLTNIWHTTGAYSLKDEGSRSSYTLRQTALQDKTLMLSANQIMIYTCYFVICPFWGYKASELISAEKLTVIQLANYATVYLVWNLKLCHWAPFWARLIHFTSYSQLNISLQCTFVTTLWVCGLYSVEWWGDWWMMIWKEVFMTFFLLSRNFPR